MPQTGDSRLAFLAVPLLLLAAGCADPLARLDARTEALMRETTRRAGLDEVIPTRTPDTGDPTPSSVLVDPQPATVNAALDDLIFDPADEARDVDALLTRYGESALGTGDAPVITLRDAFAIAQRQAREYLSAEEDYILTAIALMIERHLWSPRVFNDTSATLSANGVSGQFDHALGLINTLRVAQRLPYGGTVEAQWIVRATQDLRSRVDGQYRQSSDIVLSTDIPLLRGAGTVARESRIQAERDLIYAARNFERFRREFLVAIADDYLRLVQTKASIGNQLRQLEGQIRRNREAIAKVEAGRFAKFQSDITADAVLESRSNLASLREGYILQLDQFKVRLGMSPNEVIDIEDPDFEIQEPSISPSEATLLALEYRLDLQNDRDQVIDAQRAVKNARNGLLPDFGLRGSVAIPTDPTADSGGVEPEFEELDYSVGFDFSLPLDREIEKLTLRRATIFRERSERNFTRIRDNVIIQARQSVRNLDLARFRLQLAENQIEINKNGLRDLELRPNADPQQILDRETALLNAENARDRALSDLRIAVLEYLLDTGQLRVTEQGDFMPLPGMEADMPISMPQEDSVENPADVVPDDLENEEF